MGLPMDPVHIAGLRELQKALKDLDGEAQKELRVILNEAAEMVASEARNRMPAVTGKARASVKVASSQREARVKTGGARAPYAPWLDFGGSVGRGHQHGKANSGAVKREILKDGRYVYPSYYDLKDRIQDQLVEGISKLIEKHGLNVEGG